MPAGKVPKDTAPPFRRPLRPSWRAGFAPISVRSDTSRALSLKTPNMGNTGLDGTVRNLIGQDAERLIKDRIKKWLDSQQLIPHFPYQPCGACRNQQQNYQM